eukprot:1796884-Pyramimonas_sp.AAC.1
MQRLHADAAFELDTARAKEMSLQGDLALQAERAEKEAVVATRLALMGLRRVPIEADGHCQFRALCVGL